MAEPEIVEVKKQNKTKKNGMKKDVEDDEVKYFIETTKKDVVS